MKGLLLLLSLGALSLIALNGLNSEGNLFTARHLLSSSSSSDCDMEEVVRSYLQDFNENNGEDILSYFEHDAMRYMNGKLDDGTNGRPLNGDELKCVHAQHRVSVEIGEITTNGDDTAMFSGFFHVDNKVSGLAGTFTFHPGSCMIKDERFFFSTTSALIQTWINEIACRCFSIWEEIGACEEMAAPADIDVLARTTECWNYLSNDDAGNFAECFAPMHGYTSNGENMRGVQDLSQIGQVQQMLGLVDYSHEVVSVFAEGYDVHVQGTMSMRNKQTGEENAAFFFQILTYNAAGKITNMVFVMDVDPNVENKWFGMAPEVHYWRSAAADALGDFTAELGFPSYLSDNFDEPNIALWENPMGSYSCFQRVEIADQVRRTSGSLARDVFAQVTVKYFVVAGQEELVESVSSTVTVDAATGTINVIESSLGAAVATLHSAVQVASGASVSEVRANYGRVFASMYDQNGELTNSYRNTLQDLCRNAL